MKRKNSIGIVVRLTTVTLLIVVAYTFCCCTNKSKRDFDRLLVSLAATDHEVDGKDWSAITTYLTEHQSDFNEFFDTRKETLDTDKVKAYISTFFKNRRPSADVTFTGISGNRLPAVKFYLERSGSMVPYDSPKGDGAFKAAIMQLLNSLPGENKDNRIFIVNDVISPYPGGFDKFLQVNDIFEATKGIGHGGYTDFGAIFTDLISKTTDNEVSILVTDLIYSTKDMTETNPEKIFADAQSMTHAVFKTASADMSILVIKLHASYNGLYYSFDSPHGGKAYTGPRPYYIIIACKDDVMKRLSKDSDYSAFTQFGRLKGYENQFLFCAGSPYHPYYSLLLNHPEIKGRFRISRGQDTQVTKVSELEPDVQTGDTRMLLAVDLSHMFIDRRYLEDVTNYEVTSGYGSKILAIRPIRRGDITAAERKYAGNATHLFLLSVKKPSGHDRMRIALRSRLPQWVYTSSSDDDRDTRSKAFSTTTFGLRYLLEGIYQSYARQSDQSPTYFDIELDFSN